MHAWGLMMMMVMMVWGPWDPCCGIIAKAFNPSLLL